MKKTLKSVATVVSALILLVSLNSCKKKKDGEASTSGTATISGKITIDKDLNDAIIAKNGVAGVTILATISTSDLSLNPVVNEYEYARSRQNGSNYPSKTYSVVTDAEGNYTVTVDVADKEMYVTIRTVDFVFDQVQSGGVAKRTVFPAEEYSVWVYKGASYVYDFNLPMEEW